MTIKRVEVKWIVSKDGKHTCSNCGHVTYEFSRTCPNCTYDMGYTVDRKMKYRCECCHGLFKNFLWRYDCFPTGDDIAYCPLCGCEEPPIKEVWEEDD